MKTIEQTKYERIEELNKIIETLRGRLKRCEQERTELMSDMSKTNEIIRVLQDILVGDGMTLQDIYIYFNKKYKPLELREALVIMGVTCNNFNKYSY